MGQLAARRPPPTAPRAVARRPRGRGPAAPAGNAAASSRAPAPRSGRWSAPRRSPRAGASAPASASRAPPGGGRRSASTAGCRPRSDCRAPPPRPRTSRISNTSRATANPRASCGTATPVSSLSRNANVVPARSTSWLATTVAISSRRRRWRSHPLRVASSAVGEVALQIRHQVRVVGQVGVQQQRVQMDLAVRHQDRELGRDQPPTVRAALRQRRLRRQELELAVEAGGPLQVA